MAASLVPIPLTASNRNLDFFVFAPWISVGTTPCFKYPLLIKTPQSTIKNYKTWYNINSLNKETNATLGERVLWHWDLKKKSVLLALEKLENKFGTELNYVFCSEDGFSIIKKSRNFRLYSQRSEIRIHYGCLVYHHWVKFSSHLGGFVCDLKTHLGTLRSRANCHVVCWHQRVLANNA